jgi:S-adenosylmethionine/arginine decarboxylase-like enzyme
VAASYGSLHDDDASRPGPWSRAALALLVTTAVGVVAGAPWRAAVDAVARAVLGLMNVNVAAVPSESQQGALALMPAYQLALTVGLWLALATERRLRTLAWGLGALALSQPAFIVAVAAVHGWSGVATHALVIRGWAVAVPSALALVWTLRARAQTDERRRRSGRHDDEEGSSAVPAAGADRYAAGIEYVVDARGCDPALLRSIDCLQGISTEVIGTLALRPLASPLWHRRPGDDGVAGMQLLSESHLSIHTYPDAGLAVINLYPTQCTRTIPPVLRSSRVRP